jgi:hypothetical protein
MTPPSMAASIDRFGRTAIGFHTVMAPAHSAIIAHNFDGSASAHEQAYPLAPR